MRTDNSSSKAPLRSSKEPLCSGSRRKPAHRRHEDTPDTASAFRRLAYLPEGPERAAVREEIIRAWMPVAERATHRFRHRGESGEDLLQVAALGLVKAVDHYEPERGCAFVSFAIPTIVGELKRHLRDHLWSLHVPRRFQELHSKAYLATVELDQAHPGASPTPREIAEHTGLTESEAATGVLAHDAYRAASLDAPIHGVDASSLADTLGDDDHALDLVVDRESLKPLLADLSERQQRILYLRFFRDFTQAQIADRIGVSQMQVSRLLRSTCAQLREGLLAGA
ncbi:SigB/SigF/SigG family RNA polymerase sigma factor [Streptomyces halobius]|uniref:SigB/SigF/SigG family RNA polymerase sigma factor n=1 Tax=Streptomyces halobius TaxID=2879846 RepID=A0ABY4LZA8_9ACTN|nr:SigB/SigF/SigG family RNA polymerase sigma factor [Streptomyces halobius]UQA90562.1 SigB/SigF/SigG family RNA polymerase sigma factor [Streptomyces halobius]